MSAYSKYLQDRQPAGPPQPQYKLFYCPLNVFMFMLYFYSIYDRILKAQELVKAKVEQDFNDDFSNNEWSAKFQRKKQTLVDERFQYLVKAILTTMSHTNIMDINKYSEMVSGVDSCVTYTDIQQGGQQIVKSTCELPHTHRERGAPGSVRASCP